MPLLNYQKEVRRDKMTGGMVALGIVISLGVFVLIGWKLGFIK